MILELVKQTLALKKKKKLSEDKNLYNRRQFTHVWIQLLFISLKVDTASTENTFGCFTLNVLWQHFKHFQKYSFSASRCSSKLWWQKCQFAWLDFSLHICWNIAKWDIGRHNTHSLAQKISNQMTLDLFPAVYMCTFTVVTFTIPFIKRESNCPNSSFLRLTPGIYLLCPRLKMTLGPCVSHL